MSPGFAVADLLPRARVGGALAMGLKRIDEADWLQPSFDRAARVAAFRDRDAVAVLPEGVAAVAELEALLGRRVPGLLPSQEHAVGVLRGLATDHWEDLCLLLPDESGQWVLVAAAVGFPTDWRLADKIGRPMATIHAPIQGYAEQLAAGVDHFLARLEPGPIFARANAFVVSSDALAYHPGSFAHVTADNAGETLFVRCERQTLRRLPETGALLFAIGVAVEPLARVATDQLARLAAGVLRPGEMERRGAPGYAEALAGYAALREGS